MLNRVAKVLEKPEGTETVNMKQRQVPLCENYKVNPADAIVIDAARTMSTSVNEPLQSSVAFCDKHAIKMPVGVHTAVGGDSDNPTPGDILCGAIAACLDSTIRIISNRLGLKLKELEVEVRGEVDVRGTLRVDPNCPVGFQRFDVNVAITPARWIPGKMLDKLLNAAEYSCVVIQTVKHGAQVTVSRKSKKSSR